MKIKEASFSQLIVELADLVAERKTAIDREHLQELADAICDVSNEVDERFAGKENVEKPY